MNNLLILAISLIPAALSESVKTVRLCEKGVASILISTKGTILDFPAEPQKVVLGSKNSFSIEYIKNDLAVSPITTSSRSNLFVYLQGRRFALDLGTSPTGSTLYFIKDCDHDKSKVNSKNEK